MEQIEAHIHFWDKVKIHHNDREKGDNSWSWASGIKSFCQVLFNTQATYNNEVTKNQTSKMETEEYVKHKLNKAVSSLSENNTISIGSDTYKVETVAKEKWTLFNKDKQQKYYKLTKQTTPSEEDIRRNIQNAISDFIQNPSQNTSPYAKIFIGKLRVFVGSNRIGSTPIILSQEENFESKFNELISEKVKQKDFKQSLIDKCVEIQTNPQSDVLNDMNAILDLLGLKAVRKQPKTPQNEQGTSTQNNPNTNTYYVIQIKTSTK